jgi:hypothetical protein
MLDHRKLENIDFHKLSNSRSDEWHIAYATTYKKKTD